MKERQNIPRLLKAETIHLPQIFPTGSAYAEREACYLKNKSGHLKLRGKIGFRYIQYVLILLHKLLSSSMLEKLKNLH